MGPFWPGAGQKGLGFMVHKKGFGHMGLREGLKRASKRSYFGAYLGPILGQGLLRMGLVSSLIKGDLAI